MNRNITPFPLLSVVAYLHAHNSPFQLTGMSVLSVGREDRGAGTMAVVFAAGAQITEMSRVVSLVAAGSGEHEDEVGRDKKVAKTDMAVSRAMRASLPTRLEGPCGVALHVPQF